MKIAAGGKLGATLLPMTRSPDRPMLIGVPETVTTGAPAFTGVPAIWKDVGLAVMACPAIVRTVEVP